MTAHFRFVSYGCLVTLFLVLYGVAGLPGSGSVVYADSPDALVKKADTLLRTAERNMFSGKNEVAVKELEEALQNLDALKASDPNHKKIKTLESKYSKTKKALDRKMGQGKTAASGSHQTTSLPAAKDTSDKLPGGVSKRLRDITRDVDAAEKMADEGKVDSAGYRLEGAAEIFTELNGMYGGKFSESHPDYVAVKNRYAAVEAKVAAAAGRKEADAAQAAQAEQAMKDQSAGWVARFTPYVANPAREGHDPEKYLIFPGASQAEQLKKMLKVRDELQELYAEYQQLSFSDGKTWELEQVEGEVKFALEGFSESYASGVGDVEENANRNIDQAIQHLERDSTWKNDATVFPPVVDSKQKETINRLVAQVEQILAPGDPALITLQEKQSFMTSLDSEHRKIRARRTFVLPEAYRGNDLKELRGLAEAIVGREKPGSDLLRVSVYKDDWQEERVLESTDTTNTAIRYRVTRMINAQVAARLNGEVVLYTLHLAKDQQGKGWGKLYGHIMYGDPMAEANVKK